jgi:hypothetical protein
VPGRALSVFQYSHVHVRRESLGVVHRSRAIICRAAPNPNRTIRNRLAVRRQTESGLAAWTLPAAAGDAAAAVWTHGNCPIEEFKLHIETLLNPTEAERIPTETFLESVLGCIAASAAGAPMLAVAPHWQRGSFVVLVAAAAASATHAVEVWKVRVCEYTVSPQGWWEAVVLPISTGVGGAELMTSRHSPEKYWRLMALCRLL